MRVREREERRERERERERVSMLCDVCIFMHVGGIKMRLLFDHVSFYCSLAVVF